MTLHARPHAILSAHDPVALDRACEALDGGAIVGLPTETVYGLAVLPRPAPLAALMRAKRRSPEKGIPLLVDSLDQARELAVIPDAAQLLALRFWPGALTLVLPVRPGVDLPGALTGGRPSIALRLPDHAVPRALAGRLGPLAVSSANLSGEREARTAAELLAAIGAAAVLVIDDGPVRGGVVSSVVAVDLDGALRILRDGALSESELRAALEASG